MVSKELADDVCDGLRSYFETTLGAKEGRPGAVTGLGTQYITYAYNLGIQFGGKGELLMTKADGSLTFATVTDLAAAVFDKFCMDEAANLDAGHAMVVRAWPSAKLSYTAWDRDFSGEITVDTNFPTLIFRFRLAFEEKGADE